MRVYLILQVTVMWLLIIQIPVVILHTSSRQPGRAVIQVVLPLYIFQSFLLLRISSKLIPLLSPPPAPPFPIQENDYLVTAKRIVPSWSKHTRKYVEETTSTSNSTDRPALFRPALFRLALWRLANGAERIRWHVRIPLFMTCTSERGPAYTLIVIRFLLMVLSLSSVPVFT